MNDKQFASRFLQARNELPKYQRELEETILLHLGNEDWYALGCIEAIADIIFQIEEELDELLEFAGLDSVEEAEAMLRWAKPFSSADRRGLLYTKIAVRNYNLVMN